jgi:hypothetical protein
LTSTPLALQLGGERADRPTDQSIDRPIIASSRLSIDRSTESLKDGRLLFTLARSTNRLIDRPTDRPIDTLASAVIRSIDRSTDL